MDPDVVEQIGQRLKAQAQQIEGVIHAIEGLVTEAMHAWEGPDSQQFHEWWNSQHRPALTSAQQAIDGLGTSAINNAHDQRAVSGH
jgi:uncharacterized protein YukE